jgi:glycosyltransferase involved in cell wall biosynthesis
VRVLHLTDHYLPVLGGIETHVAALASRQAARGDDVTVLTSTGATADGRHSDDAGPVAVRRVRSVSEARGIDVASFDVVHAHVSVFATFSAPLAALASRSGAPTVVTVHSMWNGMGPVPRTAAALAGLRGSPVLWTAVSRVAADQLAHQLRAPSRIGVLPNAVEVAPRAGTPLRRVGRSVRLVSTMRVARRKRPLQLVRIFKALRASVDVPLELVVVGDGPLRPRLERRLRHDGLQSDVTVTGRVAPPAVLDLVADADIYVAPAFLESFGLAALEARCVGLPVVGHAASGMTDFIRDGIEGMLCSSDLDMVERLRELVLDHDLRRRISEHNRTVASTMTWTNAMLAHDAAYAEIWSSYPLHARSGSLPALEA